MFCTVVMEDELESADGTLTLLWGPVCSEAPLPAPPEQSRSKGGHCGEPLSRERGAYMGQMVAPAAGGL